MNRIVYVVVAAVFVTTVSAVEQKHVNIALETVLQFGQKDPVDGLAVIDKVQNALENIKRGIELRNGRRSDHNDITFADFIEDAANILKDYHDHNLEDIFVVISEEIERYIDRESELQKWFGSGNIRRKLNEQFDTLKDMQADTLRQYLDSAITAVQNKKYGEEENDLLDIGNFLYMGGNRKLKAALRHLEMLKRSSNVHLEDVARDTLQFLFFDHFSILNNNIKREVVKMFIDYLKIHRNRASKKPSPSTLDPREVVRYSHAIEKHEENRVNVNDEIKHKRKERPVARIHKKHATHRHKNKRYRSNKSRTHNKRRSTTHKVYTFKVKPRKLKYAVSAKNRYPLYRPKTDKKMSLESSSDEKPEKVTRKNILKNNKRQTLTKRPAFLKQNITKPKKSLNLNSVSAGEKKMHAIDLSGTTSSQESDEKQDKTKEEQDPQDITKDVKLQTGAYLSVERFLKKSKTNNLKVVKKEQRAFPTTNISDEGLSIEGYENGQNVRNKIMRKYLKNDTLLIDNPGSNMTKMIKNIEHQIKKENEQFDLVKNLTADTNDTSNNLTFRASHIHKNQKHAGIRKHYYPPKNSDSIERDNEEFFSRDSSERIILKNTTRGPNLESRNNVATDSSVNHSIVNKVTQNITITTKSSTKNTSKTNTAKSKSDEADIETANENDVKSIYGTSNKANLHNITKDKPKINATEVFITNGNIKTSSMPVRRKLEVTYTNNTTTDVERGFESHYTFNPLLVDNMFHK